MQQTTTKEYKSRLDRKGDPQGIVLEMKILLHYFMIFTQTRNSRKEWDA